MKNLITTILATSSLFCAAQTIPAPIKQGDKIAIITPSSSMKQQKVLTAMSLLSIEGYEPVLMPHAFGDYGSYTSSDQDRAADIMEAFTNPEYKAILCTRGGYGATRLLPLLNIDSIKAHPKWLIGYSDITALHALLNKAGIASLHAPMCGHLSNGIDDPDIQILLDIITKVKMPEYSIESTPYNKSGKANGTLVGGNMIVANGLSETPYDVFNLDDAIIFVEDVGEKIYAIERMLVRMHLSGILDKAKGLVFGEFTEYTPDEDFNTMEEMIATRLKEWGYYDRANFPILFNFPTGHGEPNRPLVLNVPVTISVNPTISTLTY